MLQPSAPDVRPPPPGGAAERRAHRRIPSAKLGITRVNIRNRDSAALVDVSSGGALLELPFQLPPQSRVAIQLHTAAERFEIPFQLLRCYVAGLRGGVTYHAAGAFDNLLNVEALAMQASSAMQRLVRALERLSCAVRNTATHSRSDARFYGAITDLLSWLRRGESLDLVTLKLKARLTQSFPSLLILPVTSATSDPATALECFGLTFKAKHPISAHDRRLLRAHAQLIALLEETRCELRDDGSVESPLVVHSTSDWMSSQSHLQPVPSSQGRAAGGPLSITPPARLPVRKDHETDLLAALMLDPAFT